MKLIRILVLLTVLLTGLALPATGAFAQTTASDITLPNTPDDPGFGV